MASASRVAFSFLLCACLLGLRLPTALADAKPNIVILFADDLGYGDLSCYGHPTLRTPNLDRMAAEGLRFTQFYAAASVCTPSRAALLTGRLPIRNGMSSDQRRVLFPDSTGGIPDQEITLAEVVKNQGYATACIGKWHLGHLPKYLPARHGFDYYFGIPYSNDMDAVQRQDYPKGRQRFWNPRVEYWNVPLMEDSHVIERPADQTTITRRYTEKAIEFIRRERDRPFFVYLAYNLPHVPLFRSDGFVGHSRRGLYGDVVEEIDWSAGEIIKALKEMDLDTRTFVFFTSDNGPWLIFHQHGGSAGLLRDGKGCTFEGGMREPAIAWWPGRIPGGRVTAEIACTMDLFVTCTRLAGGEVPADRAIDGVDLTPLLLRDEPSGRDAMFYYRGRRLMAARLGPWKAHFITQPAYGSGEAQSHDPPLLYHLEIDPSEAFNVAADHPDVIERIRQRVAEHRETLGEVPPSQLELH